MRFLEDISDQQNGKPWGQLIAASVLVQLATLSGVFVLGFLNQVQHYRQKESDAKFLNWLHKIVIPSFGSGALLSTSVFLIIPEAIEQISGGHGPEDEHNEEDHEGRFLMHRLLDEEHTDEEHSEHNGEAQAAWKFGASVLGGILFPILLGGLINAICYKQSELGSRSGSDEMQGKASEDESAVNSDPDGKGDDDHKEDCKQEASALSEQTIARPRNWSLICGILFGDAIHNFCDGIFLGTAFLLCGRAFAYTMVASTIYHEIAQEISDYALLMHQCGFTSIQALTLNFLSGFSVLFGGLLVFGMNFSEVATGCILAISAGSFLYIGCCECIPRVQEATKTLEDSMWFLFCFLWGAVPIGLVLLSHEHCEEGH